MELCRECNPYKKRCPHEKGQKWRPATDFVTVNRNRTESGNGRYIKGQHFSRDVRRQSLKSGIRGIRIGGRGQGASAPALTLPTARFPRYWTRGGTGS